VGTLFTTPTLAALAAAVSGESAEVAVPENLIPRRAARGAGPDAEEVEVFL
jgi:hypothetical protein